MIGFFIKQMNSFGDAEAVIVGNNIVTYAQLVKQYIFFKKWLISKKIPQGAVVSFDGDYSADTIALFLALADNNNIIVPLSKDSKAHFQEFREIALTQYDISLGNAEPNITETGKPAQHQLYNEIHARNNPGLVLFSSGSTGKSKGIFQDLSLLMNKFKVIRKPLRMLIFLQMDHIGGINSLLYSLANGGVIIVAKNRSPAKVCETIEKYKAELLPISPTFLNLLLLSKEYKNHDISSLKLITYGTEPMPQSTLSTFSKIYPNVSLQQTYGLSEVGILRSKSRGSDSLWVKIGGEEFDIKIVENRLFIRSESAMLGYLNAPDPFDAEGYLDTGDLVEQDGEWLRILGRESEIINVGGFKVYPAEVESVLLEIPNVEDVVVFGQSHAFTGKIVAAKFKLCETESVKEFKIKMRNFCKQRLQSYKIPSKIFISKETTYNERFKRMRRLKKEWD